MTKKDDTKNIYVIDASTLLIDPESIYRYAKSTVIIPMSVVEGLDKFKGQLNQTGKNARSAIEIIERIRDSRSLAKGILMDNGCVLKIWPDKILHSQMPVFADINKSSNRVLSSLLDIRDNFQQHQIFLVTNDTNLKIRTATYDIKSLSIYQKAVDGEINNKPNIIEITASDEDIASLEEFGHIKMDNKNHEYYPNQHMIIKHHRDFLCRYIARSNYIKLVSNFDEGLLGILPRNTEQKAALDVLLDRSIDIVMLTGKAGTGKTLLALASGLEYLLNSRKIRKILVSRPIIPLGKDIGYLPGDVEEKISPWMKPIFDNLEFLTDRIDRRIRKMGDVSEMIRNRILELEALTYIRGRSISDRFMIVDEAQNLTPHEVKTIITRTGDNTKIILTGDPEQIDNPYVNLKSNGLSYVAKKLKNYDVAAHVNLISGERSKLAELAANVL